jgi:hypothetical protein
MVVAGVVIGVLLVVIYQLLSGRGPSQNANEQIATSTLKPQPLPVLPLRSATPGDEFPSPEASPSPSVTPLASPAAQSEPAPLVVSPGMVSTGEKSGRGPFTIRLTNGNYVEADEVWQTEDGIWYRSRGVATLLDRNEVKAIEKLEEKKPATAASPASSPSSTRTVSP